MQYVRVTSIIIIYVLRFAFEISAAQSIICIIHGKKLMFANRPELKEIK